MDDLQVKPFFWFRPVMTRGRIVRNEICFRAGRLPLATREPMLARDPPGSPVQSPLMETPSWTPPNGGFYHFGSFEAMAFLLRLYVHFMASWVNLERCTKFNLGGVIKDNMDLGSLEGRTPILLLGDMSKHGGGQCPGHDTHRTGQQMDIFYIPKDGTNSKCICAKFPGQKEWHLGLNALLLHCIIEAGAWSVVTDSDILLATAKLPKGQQIKGSTRHEGMKVHADHFHVDLMQRDPRAGQIVADLYDRAENGDMGGSVSLFS